MNKLLTLTIVCVLVLIGSINNCEGCYSTYPYYGYNYYPSYSYYPSYGYNYYPARRGGFLKGYLLARHFYRYHPSTGK